MDRKEALDAWKKAKPALLLDTGVSEILRKLPDTFTNYINAEEIKSDEPKLKQILASLNDKLADKQIKAEKKAFNCIKDIQNAIKAAMAEGHNKRQEHREARVKIAEYIEKLSASASAFHKASANLKVDPAGAQAISLMEVGIQYQIGLLTNRGYYSMVMPSKFGNLYNAITSQLKKLAKAMIALVEDSKSSTPKFDSKTEYQKAWTAYGLEVAKLAKVAAAMKALGPR